MASESTADTRRVGHGSCLRIASARIANSLFGLAAPIRIVDVKMKRSAAFVRSLLHFAAGLPSAICDSSAGLPGRIRDRVAHPPGARRELPTRVFHVLTDMARGSTEFVRCLLESGAPARSLSVRSGDAEGRGEAE